MFCPEIDTIPCAGAATTERVDRFAADPPKLSFCSTWMLTVLL
jgi:hypothetical protein